MSSPRKILELLRTGDPDLQASALKFIRNHSDLLNHEGVIAQVRTFTDHPDREIRKWTLRILEQENTRGRPETGETAVDSGNRTKNDAGEDFSRRPLAELPLANLLRMVEAPHQYPITLDLLKQVFSFRDPVCLKPMCAFLQQCRDIFHLAFVIRELGELFPQPDLLPILRPFLNHSDPRLIANAIEGIAAIHTPDIIPEIAPKLQHENHRVREAAVSGLTGLNRQILTDTLATMLAEKKTTEAIKSALWTIRDLKLVDFRDRLVGLLDDPLVGTATLEVLASLCSGQITGFLNAPEISSDSHIRERILFAIQSRLSRESRRPFNPWAPPGAKTEGNVFLEIGEQKIHQLVPLIDPAEAARKAGAEKIRSLGFLSRLFFRPDPKDIVQVYSEIRLEPFWSVSGKAALDFSRSHLLSLPAGDMVSEVKIGDRITPVQDGKVLIDTLEHVHEDQSFETCIDAQTGAKMSFDPFRQAEQRWISDFTEIRGGNVLVSPPRIKASVIVREILRDLLKPIQADEINSERILIERLNLFFRPVYAFEFHWEAQEKHIVLEVDGITGAVNSGKTVRGQPKDFFNPDDLFEITSEVAGMIIPGGELAFKMARAVFRKSPEKASP
jgi:hypothetical protein